MIIGIIYKIILFFPLIKSLILGRKYSFSIQNFLIVYLLVTTINEWVSFVRNLYNSDVKVGLQYNLYFVFCIHFFFFFYRNVLLNKLKIISFIISISSLVYIIIFTYFLREDFDKKIGIIVALFYIINSLIWFYQKISLFDNEKITDDPNFWISTALLMWSCFFIFRVTPMFFLDKNDNDFLQVLKTIQNLINIIMYILFFVALIKYNRKAKLLMNK